MSRRWLIPLVTVAGAVVAARATSQSLWPTTEKSLLIHSLREHLTGCLANPFTFALDHPPIVRSVPAAPVTFRVQIRNPLAETVRFVRFTCDCGCTAGRLGLKELAAGQSSTVELNVDLHGREGAQRFACSWFDEAGRRWTAEVRVTIYAPTQFTPQVVRFGLVEPNTQHQSQVTYDEYAVSNDALAPLSAFSFAAFQTHDAKIAKTSSSIDVVGDGIVRRRTTLQFNLDAGTRSGYQELHLTPSNPARGSCRIDWTVREYVELEPRRVALTITNAMEEQRTQVVRVRGVDGNSVKIERASTTTDAIRTRIIEGVPSDAAGQQLEIIVTLADSSHYLTGDVVLVVSTPVLREVKIPVTAIRMLDAKIPNPTK